ncbi:hypothetical protein [Natronobacterium gregoryi]|uniref:Uncharacterized protein n=2 Tax=Natronobacterium gregoryi TaxID=44930 RepID=L0ACP2_NATGS|nr:hypothetical protein [Natronobacterium gregoryi]AFZ71663.1 hypothetical protein Natgr_0408 [Natronobacterium gregoryi SP2]ELY72764.1 hypothetical protein C490_02978 [Natronobacterium gregoryi SP2]PLK20287.1 hypothetical protein CYV19_10675 [Natronobacterium gregoryi SP2]SFJ24568.1 hypothetical protein SAMN05443661_1193 [Natronobacterium gregoryi]
METEHTNPSQDGDDLRATIYQYRSYVAGVLTIVVVTMFLLWLDAMSVPLAEAPVLRDGSGAIASGEMTYNAYERLWLGVRAVLGLYIAFVAVFISGLALVSWKEVLE